MREEAPDAVKVFNYGVPGYKFHGQLLNFGAFKAHCSLFLGYTVMQFADELTEFKTSKGTIQFRPERPIPEDLVRPLVRARMAENLAKRTKAASKPKL